MLAQLTAPPSPLLGPLEWLVVQSELPAEELPDFLAYLQSVERGEAMLHHPDSAPYHLTPCPTQAPPAWANRAAVAIVNNVDANPAYHFEVKNSTAANMARIIAEHAPFE